MRHVAHTMATPKLELHEAIDLFARLGFQGTEVVVRTQVECGSRHGPAAGEARVLSHEWPEAEVRDLAARAEERGVPIFTVTPYVKAFNAPDRALRESSVRALERWIAFASLLGARNVRVYGGDDGCGRASWSHAVDSLRELARCATDQGVRLLLENHPGTLTVTGSETARLIADVGHDALRALYDPANVLWHSDENWEQTLELQRDIVAYVHVKDYAIADGQRHACAVGAGVVPWPAILTRLREIGYVGDLSYEYEKKWNPDQLPDAEDGLAESMAFVKRHVELGCQGSG